MSLYMLYYDIYIYIWMWNNKPLKTDMNKQEKRYGLLKENM